ncbi:MAG: hypothetical protein NTW04_02065 [Elusimicrobia bacterium]|nr:hypothetical protein [Elusimicrobiota bacterium]
MIIDIFSTLASIAIYIFIHDMNIALNIISTLATVIIAFLAYKALGSWKEQDVIKKRYELASYLNEETEKWITFFENFNFRLFSDIYPNLRLFIRKLKEYFLIVSANENTINQQDIDTIKDLLIKIKLGLKILTQRFFKGFRRRLEP